MSWHTPSIPKSGPSPSFSFPWQTLKCHHTLTMTRLPDEQNKNSSEPLLTNGMGRPFHISPLKVRPPDPIYGLSLSLFLGRRLNVATRWHAGQQQQHLFRNWQHVIQERQEMNVYEIISCTVEGQRLRNHIMGSRSKSWSLPYILPN